MWPQPIAELQEAAGGGDGGCVRGQETRRPSCVDAAPPTLQSRAAVALFTAPAVSTLGSSGMIDASNPLGPALSAALLCLTPVLLHAGSPLHFLMFSWQKGVSLVASKMPPLRPWVGSNHKPLRLTAERYGESSTGFSWNLWG